jgi:digeranylgeranylglycerophospholipid reductase
MDFDVAVVGGSFAGLACARAAAARGLSVVVIDRRSEPGESPRTTGILVKEVAEAWDLPSSVTRTLRAVRLYAPSGRYLDLESPGYYFLATDTPALLRFLAHQASALGAQLSYGTAFRGVDSVHRGYKLRGSDIVARTLVGADGARSAVARWFGLGSNRAFLRGAEVELTGVTGLAEDRLHCFVDSVLAPGYLGWIVPGCGISQIGLAARAPERPRLDAMLRRAASVADLTGARVIEKRGGWIPVGGRVQPSAARSVLLIGDAAGHVSPLTAGGIHTALELGRCAGLAIADHVLANGPNPAEVLAAAAPRYDFKLWLRWLIDQRPPNTLIDGVFELRLFRAFAETIFFHHRGLFNTAAWRDMAAIIAGRGRGRRAHGRNDPFRA